MQQVRAADRELDSVGGAPPESGIQFDMVLH
jgi:hypothetical protein